MRLEPLIGREVVKECLQRERERGTFQKDVSERNRQRERERERERVAGLFGSVCVRGTTGTCEGYVHHIRTLALCMTIRHSNMIERRMPQATLPLI
jgi:hypothetical protein